MKKTAMRINLLDMAKFILKHCWVLILCAAVGGGFFFYRASRAPVTYTASGTMYIINANSSLYNYGYYSTTDASGAVQLIGTYSVLVRSDRVLSAVLEYPIGDMTDAEGNPTGQQQLLIQKYPGLTSAYLGSTISMSPVSETGVVQVRCTTPYPEMSLDFCNAVLQVAPDQLKELTGAGQANMVDPPTLPVAPDGNGALRQAVLGALLGAAAGAALLAVLFLLRQRINGASDLTESYTLPVLSNVKRYRRESKDPGAFLLNGKSETELVESYAKLRINLLYILADKQSNVVEVTSAISGEGKSTIAANLALSCAISGKRVVLVDADMRRGCQRDVFHYAPGLAGLSDILAGRTGWQETMIPSGHENLSIIPAGSANPNPSELLGSQAMKDLLATLSRSYDLVLLDVPPINIVSDPLSLAGDVAGSIFVVRQGFSSHREIRRALISAELTGLELLGFVFYGENTRQDSYYSRKYYKSYYHKYDTRAAGEAPETDGSPEETGEDIPWPMIPEAEPARDAAEAPAEADDEPDDDDEEPEDDGDEPAKALPAKAPEDAGPDDEPDGEPDSEPDEEPGEEAKKDKKKKDGGKKSGKDKKKKKK